MKTRVTSALRLLDGKPADEATHFRDSCADIHIPRASKRQVPLEHALTVGTQFDPRTAGTRLEQDEIGGERLVSKHDVPNHRYGGNRHLQRGRACRKRDLLAL